MSFEEHFKTQVEKLYRKLILGFCFIFLVVSGLLYLYFNPSFLQENPTESQLVEIPIQTDDIIENGIHIATGFVEGDGLTEVIQNCTNCHSAKLVTQNRMTEEGWVATIRWMQETQNLWDLGDSEEIIINYLAANYAPDKTGRRDALSDIEWYPLEEN